MQACLRLPVTCRFIFAFGAAGILVLITASTALVGVAHNSAFCLGLYSFLMVVLLLAQAALAIAFFADNSWKKKLPHDETAEAVGCISLKEFHTLRCSLNTIRERHKHPILERDTNIHQTYFGI